MIYAFGDFELDEGCRELRRGGALVPLQPKPLELLLYLVRQRDRAVPKDELLERLWPGVVVSETALSSAIRDARRALGDTGAKQEMVRTVRRHGFRFVLPVEEREAPRLAPPALRTAAVLPSEPIGWPTVEGVETESPGLATRPRDNNGTSTGFSASRWSVRRAKLLDRLLAATLIPFFLVLLGLYVHEGLETGHPEFTVAVSSASGPDEYPVIRYAPAGAPLLAAGDRVLEMGGEDLRGASALDFQARSLGAADPDLRVALTVGRGEEQVQTSMGFYRKVWWAGLPFSIGIALVFWFLLIRAPQWHLHRRAFVAGLCWSIWIVSYYLTGWQLPLAVAIRLVVLPVGAGLLVLSAFEFREGVRAAPWQRIVAGAIGLAAAVAYASLWFRALALPGWPWRPWWIVLTAAVVVTLAALTHHYRRMGTLERRQVKWYVYGFYIGLTPVVLTNFIRDYLPDPLALFITDFSPVFAPLGCVVAVVGYGWLDVDRVISATASLTVLAVVLVASALALGPRVAAAASTSIGIDAATGQWIFAFVVAAAVVPAHRWLRPRLDRWMFQEHHAREQAFEQLIRELDRCGGAEDLTQLSAERVVALLQPESVVTYAQQAEAFTPIFVRGRAVPPAFATRNPLVQILEQHLTPIASERGMRGAGQLDAFDRAALQTLDVAVIVPIRRGADLVAFTCLGPKRSGDIYTPSDLALLGLVANRISEVLLRLDTDGVTREAQAMQASLRRYLPGAVAEGLAGGAELASGECEVSVLFVDITASADFAEERRAADAFSTINRYTERISALVAARGGTVVEFSGDGMMAVFGVPEALEKKERAAVETGREILVAMEALSAEEGVSLEAGVGIATGEGFSGSIRSEDRMIWSVIGKTTNVAARLQHLTRALDATMAIDASTYHAAGYVCSDFERHPEVRIRGLRKPRDVYTLPVSPRG